MAAAAVPGTHRNEIMSGYFSRIARQGGARIGGDVGPRPGTPAVNTQLPIDHEETVMVPPRASSDVPAPRQLKPNVDATVQDQTRGQKMAKQSTSAIDPATEISPAEAKRPTPLEPNRAEVKLIEPVSTQDSSHASPTPQEKKIETLKPIESAKKIPAPPRTAETPPQKSTEKKFFEKTVEIVEGQTAEPAEVHTILLREVQEWIAAGQTTPDEVTAGVTDFTAEPIPETSLPIEREPGVVRIVEGRRSKAAAPELVQEVSMTDLREQNFELSIGSISVVVEGDERPPTPAPAQVATQPAARETPRRTSRLSRHYL
jgi:hypothetical protein